MSAGSPIVQLRVPRQLLDMIDADVVRSIQCDDQPRDTRTAWILSACLEVFRHRARARKSQGRYRSDRWEELERIGQVAAQVAPQAARDGE